MFSFSLNPFSLQPAFTKSFSNPLILFAACAALLACSSGTPPAATAGPEDADRLLIIDCLLPPQVRKLGSQLTYQAARRPIKTTAAECEIRGGEYISYDRADYKTSLNVWLPQAQAGDPEAQNYVGQIYEKGLGLPPDYKTAAHWYEQAARQNFSRAQINLGHLYEKGLGVPKDAAQALNWYRKASGIETDTLHFASSIEVAKASQSELERLRRELEQEKQKAEEYRQSLAQVEQKLNDYRQNIELIASRKRAKELELELLRAKDQGTPGEIDVLNREVRQYQAELDSTQRERAAVEQQAQQLQNKLEDTELLIASAAPTGGLLSIEVIDPPMSITRGVRGVQMEKPVKERELFGKINSAGRIDKFFVNNQPEQIDEFNMFWVTVPIVKQVTPVELVAVDRKGKSVEFSFRIFSNVEEAVQSNATDLGALKLGGYYALIIGNNDYRKLPELKTAVNDARQADEVLRNRYGFKTKLLINATRYDILLALNEFREKLTANDNFLIYYAGHGELDRVNERGYWQPVDADPVVNANWISNVAISDIVNTLEARHVMVVADSCYSGTLSSTTLASSGVADNSTVPIEWVQAMEEVRARTVMTSGGVKPVLDIGGGEHSIFAEAFLDVLNSNIGLMEGHRLYREVLRRMRVSMARVNQRQIPEYSPIKHTGHEGGEFFFVARGG